MGFLYYISAKRPPLRSSHISSGYWADSSRFPFLKTLAQITAMLPVRTIICFSSGIVWACLAHLMGVPQALNTIRIALNRRSYAIRPNHQSIRLDSQQTAIIVSLPAEACCFLGELQVGYAVGMKHCLIHINKLKHRLVAEPPQVAEPTEKH
jgi:hypothetical protein